MKRRALLVGGGAALLAAATGSFAQNPVAARRIAFVHPGTQAGFAHLFDTFRAELKSLGYVEGRDLSIEVRWGEGRIDQIGSLAAEVVALNPAVIVTATSAGVAAFKKATSTIPIVFATAATPVEQGFVASLRRPGGNVTGIMLYLGIAGKIVEIAREALPQAKRLALLVHESDPLHKLILETFVPAAERFKFDAIVVRVTRAEDLENAFKEFADRKADALYLPDLAFGTSNRRQIVERSLKARLPLLSGNSNTTVAGGLLSYGTPREENYKRAAALVDKILRGAKPGELAVEQPEKFELVINMKTAKTIGVKLSPTTMLRATKVIE